MELIFNELSVNPCGSDLTEAYVAVRQFLQTYKEAEQSGFNRIRFEKSFDKIFVAPKVTLNDFCNNSKYRTMCNLLLGLARYPYIDENSPEEARFVNNKFFIKRDDSYIDTEGLAVAYLLDSICISFGFDSYWKEIKHRLYVKDGDEEGEYDVLSVSRPDHCKDEAFKKYVESRQPVELKESTIEPDKKEIVLRDDHGKDVLEAFARRLRKSPYVNKIVNSLPYNSKATQFIKDVKENGLIEIVLTNTDKGLGLVLQSTGRNIRETLEIAKILQKKYSKDK